MKNSTELGRTLRPDFSNASPARRRNMAAIKGKDTAPEMVVRRLIHGMGYRYRLHDKALPGRPDIVLTSRHKIIEIRGCFWHRHPGCGLAANPATRAEFWRAKFAATVARDARNHATLEAAGWRILIVWECEVGSAGLAERIKNFLNPINETLTSPDV